MLTRRNVLQGVGASLVCPTPQANAIDVPNVVGLKLFSGLLPEDCTKPDTEKLLVTCELESQSGSVVQWKPGIVKDPGTASYFRVYDRNGMCVVHGSVGSQAATDDSDIRLWSTNLIAGDVISLRNSKFYLGSN